MAQSKIYLLEVLHIRSTYKFNIKRIFCQTKRPKNYLQSFQEIKTKKILESLYSETLLIITHNQNLVNKKDREILDQFCVRDRETIV